MIVISIALAILVQVMVPKWAVLPEIPAWAKILALVALLFWIGTILSASEIPAMEGLG